jgi:hypothetical protein
MDALAAHGAPMDVGLAGPVLPRLGRILAISAITLLAVMGLAVCFRRATGALVEPLSPAVLTGLGIMLAALALLFRRTFAAIAISRTATYALWAAPSAVLAIWIAAVSLPDSDTLGLVALVGTLLVEEGWSWGRLRVRADRPSRPSSVRIEPPTARAAAGPLSGEVCHSPSIDAEPDEAVMQNIVRRRDPSGEVIEGYVRVLLAASQRHAAAHVAICPPLDRVPECFAEQMDGPPATIKVAQVLPHGVRFEIKLDDPAPEPTSVIVEFSIQDHDESASSV